MDGILCFVFVCCMTCYDSMGDDIVSSGKSKAPPSPGPKAQMGSADLWAPSPGKCLT